MPTLKRRNIIIIFVILMVSVIVILDVMLITDQTEASQDYPAGSMEPSIPVEEGVFEHSEFALKYKEMPTDSLHGRVLDALLRKPSLCRRATAYTARDDRLRHQHRWQRLSAVPPEWWVCRKVRGLCARYATPSID